MATDDVPGANPKNADRLAMGCWAEHADGSLIFVKSVEAGKVIYEIYDMADTPPTVYSDSMLEDEFKRYFSFKPAGKSDIKWTWHDKTPFPWDRVMKTSKRPQPGFATADDQLTAAQRVVESLKRRGRKLIGRQATAGSVSHLVDTEESKGLAVIRRIGEALLELTEK